MCLAGVSRCMELCADDNAAAAAADDDDGSE